MKLITKLIITASFLVSAISFAETEPRYGQPITLAQAKTIAAAAEAEANENNWGVTIVVVDSGGNTVLLQKLDGSTHISTPIAEGKAKTAVLAGNPTKGLNDAIGNGGGALVLLSISEITPLEGGLPIVVDGKIIGGVGVSGARSVEDSQIAQAGLDALVKP